MLRQRQRASPSPSPSPPGAGSSAVELERSSPDNDGVPSRTKIEQKGHDRPDAPRQTFLLTKSVMLRCLGLIYVVAFKVALDQNLALIGSHGLTPAAPRFEALRREADSALQGFMSAPTLFWFVPLSDRTLLAVECAGLVGGLLLAAGAFSSLLCLALWLLYFSVVTAAQGSAWYSYGWESQLLETGFLAVFLCSPFDLGAPPSLTVLWLFRWLSFRISTGAGLIKVRGSSCWTDRTCLWYHFETQPNPSPLSFVFHFLPRRVLSGGVDLDILVQLYASWLVLVPGFGPLRHIRRGAGAVQALFMANIALSGNFSFLNHLTMVPALACLDDACWPRALRWPAAESGAGGPGGSEGRGPRHASDQQKIRWLVDLTLLLTVAGLSAPVVSNLLQLDGSRQLMNASFGAFRLVNTYGAFGNVGKQRYEPVVSVSHDGVVWHELEFPCKPGRVDRRPCFCAPYHYRLDWNVWFLGFKPHRSYLQRRETWMWPFLAKVLRADAVALSLLAQEASQGPAFYPDGAAGGLRAPSTVKVDMWRYRMRAPLWELLLDYVRNGSTIWWTREYEEPLIPSITEDSELLLRELQRNGY